ncbi:LysM peptidoglycan-binding domain-containing protein, partial [Bacillus sp. JJ1562]|uniref:LysM peptidoglycan-binding domain-containing protein n=1 Tax=Bacillus sp. JJ1562 TaxID=3122960 RepID=UPI003002C475
MEIFTHYKINETAQGIEVILYLTENATEFSAELGSLSKMNESSITNEATSFIKRKLPLLKIKTCKIMAGGMLLSVLGIGALPSQKTAAAKNTVTQSQTTTLTYKVSAGDTLYSIAKRYGTTVDALKQANHLSSDVLQIGQSLIIPSSFTATPNQATYQVVSGDTLYNIATRNGTTVDAIKLENNLSSDFLQIGQTLKIPNGVSSAPTQTNETTHQVVPGDTLY